MSQNNPADFQVEDGTLIKYNGEDAVVSVPSYIKRIAPDAFRDNKTLKKIATPYKLVRIGNRAFHGCDNLTEVLIPGALFRRVNLRKIFSDPDKIYFRFYASNGLEAEFDDSDYGDDWDNLLAESDDAQSVRVGKVVGASTLLMEVTEEREYSEEIEEDSVSFRPLPDDAAQMPLETLREKIDACAPKVLPPEELSIERKRELLNITDFLIDETTLVKYIGDGERAEVPDFITSIGANAFSNTSVTEVVLPEGLNSISSAAFAWCEKLTKINLPSSLKMIDEVAFANCSSLTELVLPEGLEFIGAGAFHACSALEKVILPSTLTTLSRRVFDFCVSLKEIIIPESVTAIQDGAFSHCESLKSIHLPDGISRISNWTFADCTSLTEFNFPAALEEICDVAFLNCVSLKRIDIPATVTKLGRQCFVGCKGLILISAPEKLRSQIVSGRVFRGIGDVEVDYND